MSFISVFEALNKLYESVEPEVKEETTEAQAELVDEGNESLAEAIDVETDDELEEGIFDKKNSAEMNNARKAFELEVDRIAGDSLEGVAHEMTSLLKSTIEDFKIQEEKKANHQTADASMKKIFENKANSILKLYEELLKTFKKPNNFYQAASVIENAAAKILGSYTSNSDAFSRLKKYSKILLDIGNIKAENKIDKKVHAEALVKLFNRLSYYLNSDLQLLKKKPKYTLFESMQDDSAEEPAVEAEEARQLVIECANCGAIVIRAESDIKVDEETDLVNMEEACQYCEETAGYKIVGIVAPYGEEEATIEKEAAEDEDMANAEDEPVEEGLLDVSLPIDVDVQANGNDVSVGSLG